MVSIWDSLCLSNIQLVTESHASKLHDWQLTLFSAPLSGRIVAGGFVAIPVARVQGPGKFLGVW